VGVATIPAPRVAREGKAAHRMTDPIDPPRARLPASPGEWHRAWCVTGAALLAVALAGCTMGPDYARPDAPAPAAWKELPPHKMADPQDTLARGKWWERFGDPVLNELEERVLAANQTLRAAEANYAQARAAVGAARAGLFPSVSAGASAARTRSRGGSGSGSGSAASYSTSVDAQWELDLWGRVRRLVEAAQDSAQGSAADLESTRLSLQVELAVDYLQLRVADAARKVLEDTLAAYERSLVLTQNRYSAGVVARAEVVQAETQLLGARASLIDIEATRAQLEHAIAALTGRAPSEVGIAAVSTLPMLPEIPVGVPSALLERRPDVAAAERRVAAANAQVGAATAAIFPTLTLSASGGFVGSSLASWLSLPNRAWSLGAAFAGPLFDAGLRQSQREQAVAAYDAAVADYRQVVLDSFRDVEDNLVLLRVLADESKVQQEALRAARESVTLTTNQYKAGLVAFIDVVTVQAVAFAAERTALEIEGRRLVAAANLVKALGGGFDAATLASATRR
jgi:NodT family efflux transporter outer membrane factor (OMF) lipoprotein